MTEVGPPDCPTTAFPFDLSLMMNLLIIYAAAIRQPVRHRHSILGPASARASGQTWSREMSGHFFALRRNLCAREQFPLRRLGKPGHFRTSRIVAVWAEFRGE